MLIASLSKIVEKKVSFVRWHVAAGKETLRRTV